MAAIADSSAVMLPGRVLTQHQAALTLIKDRVESPQCSQFMWLDLSCGRGQILACISDVFSEECRRKIHYVGIDVVQDHCLQAELLAKRHLASCRTVICDIDKFEENLQAGEVFDAVTFTNTVHEITPNQLSHTFVSAICRVSPHGLLYVYDMERVPEFELGAVPWLGSDIEAVLHCLLKEAGESRYFPTVATWPHKSCRGWHFQLNKRHLTIVDSNDRFRQDHVQIAVSNQIRTRMEQRLWTTHQALSDLSRYGSESAEEKASVQRLLNEYWAISRSLGGPVVFTDGKI